MRNSPPLTANLSRLRSLATSLFAITRRFALGLAALVFELGALLALVFGTQETQTLAVFVALHAVASAFAALAIGALFPALYRKPRRWLWAALFGANLFVPLIGLAASVLGVFAGALFPQLLQPRVFRSIANPEYTPPPERAGSRLPGAAVRARLLNRELAAATRVEALLTLGGTSARATGALLRELLADPSDDMRLLAYGMLDRREKEISDSLARERRLLALAEEMDDRETTRTICARVAQLYWEFVYQDLTQGDAANFALQQALIHAERALAGDAGDGAKWMLIARVELKRGQLAAADGALAQALAAGTSRAAVLPYLAELRFLQGRHRDVRAAMFELGNKPGSERLLSLQQYWAA